MRTIRSQSVGASLAVLLAAALSAQGCNDVGSTGGPGPGADDAAADAPGADATLPDGAGATTDGGGTGDSAGDTAAPTADASEDATGQTPDGTADAEMDAVAADVAMDTASDDVAVEVGPDAAPDASDAGYGDSGGDSIVDSSDGATGDGAAHDGPSDTGVAEAGVVPCTSSGQTGCVQCNGDPGQTVCTPTEAVIVERDISKGFLSSGQLAQDTSCYWCLVNAGCINGGGFSGQECGDLSGTVGTGARAAETKAAACVDTLSCVMQATSCANLASDGISNCFCGAAATTSTACAALGNFTEPTAAGQPNGVCAGKEFDGFGYASGATNNTSVLSAFTTPSTGSGMANAILTCAGSNSGVAASCPQCFQ
jgi:hypothetical protein